MRFPKPWYRPSRGVWYVTLNGSQINLGSDKKLAFEQYKELIAKRPVISADSVLAIFDSFLDWAYRNRAIRTYEFYRDRLEDFT